MTTILSASEQSANDQIIRKNISHAMNAACAMLGIMEMMRRIILGADHAGFALKEEIKKHLITRQIDIIDVGTFSPEPCDYPPIMLQACAAVIEHRSFGIILGGSGNGEAMVANKVHGIRCARCVSVWDAEMARKHNDAQVMSLGGRVTDAATAIAMVDVFLQTPYEGGRHQARLEQFPDFDASLQF